MPAHSAPHVQHVDVVFKTHLDLGFTGLARDVVARYFGEYIPSSLALAAKTREAPHRFVWTTASWLVEQYLEQASAAGRRQMEEAIAAGDFHWLALPFTTHTELMDGPLLEAGLAISQRLDTRFGRQTRAAKMTDVPGHTKALVPYLAQAGVRLLHIGINPASAIVRVPPIFRWRFGGEEVVVIYEHDYGKCTRLPGGHALSVNLTGDNLGPQGLAEVAAKYQQLQRRFPGAHCQAGNLSEVADRLWAQREEFPVVESELGDSWIHGAGTDPGKVARYRALNRLRGQWLAQGVLQSGEATDRAMSNGLLLTAEHTWGMDIKSFLKDWRNYSRKDFDQVRATPPFQLVESSWQEQREYVSQAVAALPVKMRLEAEAAFAEATPHLNPAAGVAAAAGETRFALGAFEVRVCPESGALNSVKDAGGRVWARPRSPLGALTYQSFSAADYERFYQQYNRIEAEWARRDFTKPGLGAEAVAGRFTPCLREIRKLDNGSGLLLHLEFAGELVRDLGAPPQVLLEWSAPTPNSLALRVEWLGKPANRMPEALWLHFAPPLPPPTDPWILEKLGQPIPLRDIARGGSAQLHACSGPARRGGFSIESLDAPLLAPGQGSLLNFVSRIPRAGAGISYNLFNNVWGTNFPMWCEGDAVFRFHLTHAPTAPPPPSNPTH